MAFEVPLMTGGVQHPASLRELPGRYFRGAAIPTAAVGVVTTVLAGLADGGPAVLGAGLGVVVVLGFFGIDLLAMRMSANWDPVAAFGVVMSEYLGKIIALAILFAALAGQSEPQQVSTRWVGIGLAVSGVVFLTALVVAYLRVPTFVIEPESPEEDRDIAT